MPRRAARPCRKCGKATTNNPAYCDGCTPPQRAAYDAERGSAAARGYGHRWRKLRRMVLAREPLCADPFGIHAQRNEVVLATDVDHITPRAHGGTDAIANLQPLCHSCHSRKTATQSSGWGAAGEGGRNL